MADLSFIEWDKHFLYNAKENKSIEDALKLYDILSKELLKENPKISKDVRVFLATAFASIVDGENPKKALLLSFRGKQPLSFYKKFEIASYAQNLLSKGDSYESVMKATSEYFGYKADFDRHVKKIHAELKELVIEVSQLNSDL